MKEFEASIFNDYQPNDIALLSYGFIQENGSYILKKNLPTSSFLLEVKITLPNEVEIKVYDDDFVYVAYRAKVLGEFSSQVKKEIEEILLDIRDHCFKYMVPPSVYLLPSNPKIYDIKKGFKENEGFLNWPARKKTKPGDRIFIYSAIPFKGIAFSCTVIAVDEMKTEEYHASYYLTLIRLDATFDQDELPLDALYSHGLKTVRFLHKVQEETASYLLEMEEKHNKTN